MSEVQAPSAYYYDILKASNHDDLRDMINVAAAQGWEPVECYAALGWNTATFVSSAARAIDHFCLMRRPA